MRLLLPSHIGVSLKRTAIGSRFRSLDPGAEISKFYLEQLRISREVDGPLNLELSLSSAVRRAVPGCLEKSTQGIPDQLKKDPLVRSSFFWALRHGDVETKLQVIQAFGLIADNEVRDALAGFHSRS